MPLSSMTVPSCVHVSSRVTLRRSISRTSHPIMHRTLPPWSIRATSIPPPTRGSPGRSKQTLVPVVGRPSRPHRMASYVCGCKPLHNMHHPPVFDGGPIVCACIAHGRSGTLDLTHPRQLPIPSSTEPCRRGQSGLHLYLHRRGRHLDGANHHWFP